MMRGVFGRRSVRVMAAVLMCSIGLAGCAGQQAYDSRLSPAQNQLRQQNARFNQTVGEGAVAGAVLGGIAGLALGGRNRAGAAAIGAAAGGALGAGAGYLVARNNLTRASTEQQFSEAIQQSAADAQAFRSSAQASRQIADQATADATRLRAQVRAGQITQAQYRSELSRFQEDQNLMRQQITEAQNSAAASRRGAQVASGSDRTQLAQSASAIEASRADLQQSELRMSQLIAGGA